MLKQLGVALSTTFLKATTVVPTSSVLPRNPHSINKRIMSVVGAAGTTTDDQTNAAERRAQGEFVRGVSTARQWISSEPNAKYPAEMGRYHLYVAYNCPCK